MGAEAPPGPVVDVAPSATLQLYPDPRLNASKFNWVIFGDGLY